MTLPNSNEAVYPFSYLDTVNLVVTSANSDRQLYRAPWPLDMYVELLDVRVTNSLGSGGQIVMWDQDLSNTTPTTVGSAGQALAIFGVGGAAMSGVASATITYEPGPTPRFYGGIAMQASALNAQISATVRIMH